MTDEAAMLSETLKEELAMLKKKSRTNMDFTVLWIPKADSAKEGEVIGNRIYVYSANVADALETLRHEFFDAMVCSAAAPYLDLVNALLSVISKGAYQKKEDVVESLVRTMERSDLILGDAPSEKNPAAV